MTTVREHIANKLEIAREDVERISVYLYNLDPQLDGSGLGELEVDRVFLIGSNWLSIGDSSHKELGAQLATIADQTAVYVTCGSTRTAVFKNVGPFGKVDLDRPNTKCRKVRVRKPAREEVISICGDVPEGYELLEELDA